MLGGIPQEQGEKIADYATYPAAQKAVSQLVEADIPARDIAIVGFDNTSFCRLAQNSLSSIDQFAEMLGENAAEMMLERIEGRIPSRHIKLEPSLVLRDSSAAPGIKIARSRGRNSQS